MILTAVVSALPREVEKMEHSIFQIGAGRDFIVFNDQELGMEKITDADLQPIAVPAGSPLASAAWSSGCDWYFIVTEDAILLLNVHSNRGVRCNKKSAAFIEAFMTAPYGKRKKRAA